MKSLSYFDSIILVKFVGNLVGLIWKSGVCYFWFESVVLMVMW